MGSSAQRRAALYVPRSARLHVSLINFFFFFNDPPPPDSSPFPLPPPLPLSGPREPSRQAPRAAAAARPDPALLRLRPAAARHALARQVHDRVRAGERRRLERAGFGVPAREALPRHGRRPRAADDTHDAVAGGRETRDERRADEPARAGDGDRPRPRGPCHVAPIMIPLAG